MTNEKQYDPKKLTDVAVNLYHAVTGKKPDQELHERIGAGVEAAVGLYETNPQLLRGALEAVAPLIDNYIEDQFKLGERSYDSKKTLRDIADLFKKD